MARLRTKMSHAHTVWMAGVRGAGIQSEPWTVCVVRVEALRRNTHSINLVQLCISQFTTAKSREQGRAKKPRESSRARVTQPGRQRSGHLSLTHHPTDFDYPTRLNATGLCRRFPRRPWILVIRDQKSTNNRCALIALERRPYSCYTKSDIWSPQSASIIGHSYHS